MIAQRLLYIVGTIFLLLILMWQLSEAAYLYPPEIQKRIEGVTPVNCAMQTHRKVSIIGYMRPNEKWLVMVYTKDEQEMEIWFYELASRFSLMFGMTDKIFFYENGQWLDQDAISEEEARRLDLRLKFTSEEKHIFKGCLLTATEALK